MTAQGSLSEANSPYHVKGLSSLGDGTSLPGAELISGTAVAAAIGSQAPDYQNAVSGQKYAAAGSRLPFSRCTALALPACTGSPHDSLKCGRRPLAATVLVSSTSDTSDVCEDCSEDS